MLEAFSRDGKRLAFSESQTTSKELLSFSQFLELAHSPWRIHRSTPALSLRTSMRRNFAMLFRTVVGSSAGRLCNIGVLTPFSRACIVQK